MRVSVLFSTEFRKYFRSRFGVFLCALIAFENLWLAALLIVALSRETVMDKTILYSLIPSSQLHSLLAPIMLTVLASKVATIEHDAHSYKLLFANGVEPKSLFMSKLTVLFISNGLISIIHCLTIVGVMTAKGLSLSLEPLLMYLGGIILAGIAMSSIQLYLALCYEKQQIMLLVSGLGGLIGSMALFVPKIVAMFLPWQYFGLLLPASPTYEDGTMVALTTIPNYGLIILFVAVVGIVSTPALAYFFQKKILR